MQQNRKVLTWEDNSRLAKSLKNVTLPERQFLAFPVGQGMEAQVLLMIPPNIDKSGKKKYPLLINVYVNLSYLRTFIFIRQKIARVTMGAEPPSNKLSTLSGKENKGVG